MNEMWKKPLIPWIMAILVLVMISIPASAQAPPDITESDPSSPVADCEGATRAFDITVNQTVNVSWQINGTEVINESDVTESSYENTSAVMGTWNVSAVVENNNGTDMLTWIWNVMPSEVWVDDDFNETTTNWGVTRFNKTQDGIDAVCPDSGIVHVSEGTYNESIVIDKSITVKSESTPVIDAMGADIAVYIIASEVVFDGFTVTNVSYDGTGIVAEDASEVQIINNIVELDMVYGVGILVGNVTDVVVDWNTVNITAEVWAEGIDVFDSENAQVTNNIVDLNTTAQTTGGSSILAVNVKERPDRGIPDKLAVQDVGASADYYAEAYGIYVESDNAIVDHNTVDFTVLCEGPDPENNYYEAYGVGIVVNGDNAEVTVNTVTGNATATTYAYADGIYAGGYKILVEGNTINLNNQAEYCYSWGMWVWASEKAQVLTNNINIVMNSTDDCWAEGIEIEYSDYAKINGNTIIIDADAAGDDAYAGAEAIEAYNCYRIEIAGNTISIASDVELEGSDGLGITTIPEEAIAIREAHDISVSDWTGCWADGYGISVYGYSYNPSHLASIHDNVIDISASATPASDAYGDVEGYTWIEGIYVGSSSYARGAEIINNTITLDGYVDVGAYGYDEDNGDQWTYGWGCAESRGIYVESEPWIDGPFYHLPTVADNTIEINNLVTNVTAANTTYAGATSELMQDKQNLSESLELLYGIIGQAVEETEGTTLGSSYDYGWTWADGYTWGEGIYTSGDAVQVTGNDVSVYGKVTGTADMELIQTETWTEARGWVGTDAEGIDVNSADSITIGETTIPARIDGNTINIDGDAQIEAIAAERIAAEDVGSYVYPYTWSEGIDGYGDELEITNNNIDISGTSKGLARATTEIDGEWAEVYLEGWSESWGIDASNRYGKISGNTINAECDVLMDLEAAGNDPWAYGYGESYVIGIDAYQTAEISDNDVTVSATTDGAVVSTDEGVSTAETGSLGATNGFGVGIWRDGDYYSLIDGNDVIASGSVNLSVLASEEREEAYSTAEGAGIGIGIVVPYYSNNEITRNNVAGTGSADVEAISMGDYPESAYWATELGIGVLFGDVYWYDEVSSDVDAQYYSRVNFNNLVGSSDYGLLDTDYWNTDASYNWWGDASGPSGWGPGIDDADAVEGTSNYEPWLTQPFETVLDENKAYFGFEILHYALREGWNTMSTPIALEDDTWGSISNIGDDRLDYEIAYGFDASTQSWVQILDTSKLNPLDAIYIKMDSDDRLPLCISPAIKNPPVKQLKVGWNLIGPAYRPGEDLQYWEYKQVDEALISIEKTSNGLTGYSMVVSPPLNEESWTYTINQDDDPAMDVGRGYWVYMENPDELAGFSSTPFPIPFDEYEW